MRIFIHVHVFYENLWNELSHCIRNIIEIADSDLYVTTSNQSRELIARVKNDFPFVHYHVCENRGYDIAPFVEVLNSIDLDSYDYVIKLHTKRDIPDCWINYHHFTGGEWRKELLSFCSTKHAISHAIKSFCRNPKLGLITSRRLIDPSGCASGFDANGARKLIVSRFGLCCRGDLLVYGSMFMIRAHLLKCMWRKMMQCEFPIIDSRNVHVDMGLAGDCEGAFGILVKAQGFYASDGCYPQWLDMPLLKIQGAIYTLLRRCSNFFRGKV